MIRDQGRPQSLPEMVAGLQAVLAGTDLLLGTEPLQFLETKYFERSSVTLTDFSKKKVATETKATPFLPPFSPNVFIHSWDQFNLLKNQFPLTQQHFLITTREFRSQLERATALELLHALVTMLAMGRPAVAFYNNGAEAGFTVIHKHFQVLSQSPRMVQLKQLRLFVARIVEETPEALGSIVRYDKFKFRHGLVPVLLEGKGRQEVLQSLSKALEQLHTQVARDSSINLILGLNFLLAVPRSSQKCGEYGLNSNLFLGFILTARWDERLFDFEEVCRAVTFPPENQ